MMTDVVPVALAGLAAGLGVAMPLGPIAALLLREGVVNGFRVAAGGAAGVATVDLGYCAVATVTGAAISRAVSGARGAVLVVSGLVVVAIGVRQAWSAWRARSGGVATAARTSPLRAYAQFVGLTAVNPTTLVYFVALAGAVAVPGGTWLAPVVFVVAVGVASLTWQLVLAGVGSALRGAIPPRAARLIGLGASLVVIVLGMGVLAGGLRLVA